MHSAIGRLRAQGRETLLTVAAIAAAAVLLGASLLAGGADVRLTGLAKRHGRRVVLDRLSHRFSPGAVHVVAGPSGSGKTTLLDLIAGADAPDVRGRRAPSA